MHLTRIYCRRKRDGVLFRFNSRESMLRYTRDNGEGRRTMPVIDRTEFIRYRNQRYQNPMWIRSTMYVGMAMMREGDGGLQV